LRLNLQFSHRRNKYRLVVARMVNRNICWRDRTLSAKACHAKVRTLDWIEHLAFLRLADGDLAKKEALGVLFNFVRGDVVVEKLEAILHIGLLFFLDAFGNRRLLVEGVEILLIELD